LESALVKDEPTEIEISAKDKKNPAPVTAGESSDVAPDVLYWCGMHHLQQKRSNSLDKAREFFLRAVQRADHPPHPLALYMLGWLAELKGDLKAAERYYCYALQLEPIDSLFFLRLKKLSKDTLSYVKGLAKSAEKAEVHRKRVLKKKNKLRRRGVSVPVGFEADETGELATALGIMRKRMLLHERVFKLAGMRKEQLGKRLVGLNVPGKCVSLDPFWQERLLHAFTECDDWASLLRDSNTYKKI
jgi:tetratricopeptide (TPR) repeat protein